MGCIRGLQLQPITRLARLARRHCWRSRAAMVISMLALAWYFSGHQPSGICRWANSDLVAVFSDHVLIESVQHQVDEPPFGSEDTIEYLKFRDIRSGVDARAELRLPDILPQIDYAKVARLTVSPDQRYIAISRVNKSHFEQDGKRTADRFFVSVVDVAHETCVLHQMVSDSTDDYYNPSISTAPEVTFSSDGTLIAMDTYLSGDRSVLLWNLANQSESLRIPWVHAPVFSPDNRKLAVRRYNAKWTYERWRMEAAGLRDPNVPDYCELEVWDTERLQRRWQARLPSGPARDLAFSPDSSNIALMSGRKLQVFDGQTGALHYQNDGYEGHWLSDQRLVVFRSPAVFNRNRPSIEVAFLELGKQEPIRVLVKESLSSFFGGRQVSPKLRANISGGTVDLISFNTADNFFGRFKYPRLIQLANLLRLHAPRGIRVDRFSEMGLRLYTNHLEGEGIITLPGINGVLTADKRQPDQLDFWTIPARRSYRFFIICLAFMIAIIASRRFRMLLPNVLSSGLRAVPLVRRWA